MSVQQLKITSKELFKTIRRGFRKIYFRRMPHWWRKSSTLWSIMPEIMLPFSVIYYLVKVIKERGVVPEKLAVPVLCIGNFTAGGAGKTPVVMATGKMLLGKGKKIAFVSRGYGGNIEAPTKVDLARHTASEVGDEPLMLAKIAPCFIGADKLSAAKAAIADGAEILILDDGLQNKSIVKDISIAVVDGGFGFGNGMVIPAGPLREPVIKKLGEIHAVLIIGKDVNDVTKMIEKKQKKIISAELIPDAAKVEKLKTPPEKKYIAFAGIAMPDKFFKTLDDIKLNLVERYPFPDHYNYKNEDLKTLSEEAKQEQATLITTEKDETRLPQDIKASVEILPVTLQFKRQEEIESLLEKITRA